MGITNLAIVEKGVAAGLTLSKLQHHIDQAFKYLELRTYATYTEEFIEERWATMNQLGSLEAVIKVITSSLHCC